VLEAKSRLKLHKSCDLEHAVSLWI